ncbi:MAG: OsmC family protein [Anaerolineae bacterium]|nr:OsmC family protein [Anaerolineae bacterium]
MPSIKTHYLGEKRYETHVGDFRVAMDSSSDCAPTPPQIFIASLGGCVTALVSGYCARNGLDASGLAVQVDYDWGENVLVDIQITIDLPNCTVAQREKAILRVAEHCPVHETITQGGEVHFRLRDQATLANLAE